MPSPPVADTSVLQYLHQLGRLELLRELYGPIAVPRAVDRELSVGRRRPAANLPVPSEIPWLTVVQVQVPADLASLLHRGEREVIAQALESGALALLDDLQARQTALSLGLQVTGTAGVLLACKRVGLLAALAPELDRLEQLDFRIRPALRAHLLQRAGEGDEPGAPAV